MVKDPAQTIHRLGLPLGGGSAIRLALPVRIPFTLPKSGHRLPLLSKYGRHLSSRSETRKNAARLNRSLILPGWTSGARQLRASQASTEHRQGFVDRDRVLRQMRVPDQKRRACERPKGVCCLSRFCSRTAYRSQHARALDHSHAYSFADRICSFECSPQVERLRFLDTHLILEPDRFRSPSDYRVITMRPSTFPAWRSRKIVLTSSSLAL